MLSPVVPWGSILSPVPFNVYKKPLGKAVRGVGLRYHQCGENTQLYHSIPSNSKEVLGNPEPLPVGSYGLDEDKLKFNPDKMDCLVLLVGSSSVLGGGYTPVLDGAAP